MKKLIHYLGMGSVKIPLLLLHTEVGEKWLEKCHEKIIRQMYRIETEFKPNHIIDTDKELVVSKDFIMFNYSNINPKYAKLVSCILRYNQVKGIWKEYLIGTDVIKIIRLYGYKKDLYLAHNMLHYLLNGFDRYFDNHVKKLRLRRRIRRAQGIKIVQEVDARKRTNQNISNKVKTLEYIIGFETKHINVIKDKLINDHILLNEKLDSRTYRNMKRITLKSVTSRKGIIQLNRIIWTG